MNIDIFVFGIARDIIGSAKLSLPIQQEISITELKEVLTNKFPDFAKIKSFAIAVNQEYQEDEFMININDEIAIIPPVSGG